MRRLFLLLVGLCAATATGKEATPDIINLCIEDQDNYPWILHDRPGYLMLMMEMVSQRTGLRFQYQAKPWKRCLLEMQQNAIDGVINASFVAERLNMGVYPMREGKPDPSRRMLNISYSLYKLRDSKLGWDGRQFSHLVKAIGAQTKFSIIGPLQAAGARVDDSAKDARDVLRFVLLGTVDGAALLTLHGDRLLLEHPELGARLERVPQVLSETANYLMFSHQFAQRYPQTVQRSWDAIAAVRESAEFQQQVAPLFAAVRSTPTQ